MNRILVEKAKSMMFDAELPKYYWNEAISTADYLVNRSPTKGFKKLTLEEAWTGEKPDLFSLVFGCKILAHVPKEKRQK